MANLNPQTHSNEFLLNNYVDEDIKAMLRPINFMMSTQLLQKYTIRDNFITSNSIVVKSLSFCITLILMLIQIREDFHNVIEKLPTPSFQKVFPISYIIFNACFYNTGIIINFITNIRNSENNIDLILTIQKVHKTTKTYKNYSSTLSIWSWFYVTCYMFYYVVRILIKFIIRKFFSVSSILIFFYNANMIYAIRLIIIIRYELTIWIIQVQRDSECCNIEIPEKDITCEERDFKKNYKAFFNILRAFNLYKDVNQGMVSFYIA